MQLEKKYAQRMDDLIVANPFEVYEEVLAILSSIQEYKVKDPDSFKVTRLRDRSDVIMSTGKHYYY